MQPICLITPPSGFLLDERVFMSLGILRVAAVLESRGFPVEVLDLSGIENYEDVAESHVLSTAARTFGLTATTPQVPAARRIAARIRKARPGCRIILGGPHVTLVTAAYKQEVRRGALGRGARALDAIAAAFDVLVTGDGEEAIFHAVSNGAARLIDADEPGSPLFLTNDRLSTLPYPARHLVDVDSYHYYIENRRALSLIAQLGCPFECGFCGGRSSPSLRRVRIRSIDNIVDEMVLLFQQYDATGFMFYDDELNVNRQMLPLMRSISDVQKSIGTDWRLRGFVKAELFTEEQAAAMYAAGFRWILVGFESGAPRILQNINKKATLDDNTRCVAIARSHGLKVKALMSIGHPGETRETVRQTHDWLLAVKPDDFDVTIITPYPGTPYYDEAVQDADRADLWVYTYAKTGDRLYGVELDYTLVAEYYKGNPDGGYRAYVYTDELTADDLVSLRDSVERDVRHQLGIPFNPSAAAIRYEHTMGQIGALPSFVLRSTYQASDRVHGNR